MKKRMIYSLILVLVVTMSSCESWLDVQPRTKVKSDVLFETEAGFKDALIGAYTLLKAEALYGRNLSFGFVEVLPGAYNIYQHSTYKDLAAYPAPDYTTTSLRPQIDAMWEKMYNLLANVNNLLDNIDVHQSVFTGDNYNIIKGEALGLRAFVHFDLLRLFSSATDLEKEAIPYVKSLQIKVPQVYSGKEVLVLLNEDIKEALVCLDKDPIREGKPEEPSEDDLMNNRQMRFNYFAVRALQARVAMWGKDLKTAKEAAGEILEVADELFPWVTTDAVSATEEKNRDYTFSTEHLFALHVRNLKELSNKWFLTFGNGYQIYCNGSVIDNWYQVTTVGVNDYRANYLIDNTGKYQPVTFRKYYQPEGYKADYAKRIPLIRRSEMSYIMAECLMGEDDEKALEYLNEVRRHRGITTDVIDANNLRSELTREYIKEFWLEGQFFYYCKRNGMTAFSFNQYKPVTEEVYVLPKPDKEIEFGDYYTADNSKTEE